MTLAGALVQCNAEVLSGLVIHQLGRPGAPFLYGAMPAPMDMRTSIGLYGAPELFLGVAAAGELSRHYGLPFFGTAGCGDSRHLDYQAVMEAMTSCLLAGLNRADMVHDVGVLDHSNIISPELIVLTNEMIDMVRPIAGGIKVNDETLAMDVIRRAALPKGSYLEEDHTYRHFREIWYPELLDRSMAGQTPELKEKVQKKLKSILDTHQVEPLEKTVLKDLASLTGD